ncbi:hypothetical protein BV898_10821 [Hypsibius exemplaris]|uniref:TNFR-Cys domain-containing protein n=1 Tax=Hypsibius exemplaris TaxID=2072580 RepID=A0A1W0WIT1_HYPEX|nr:hypothetical protein BV898_10821 [Hypsibius exemplaris]
MKIVTMIAAGLTLIICASFSLSTAYETPRVDCYRAYEQNFTCEVCETTTHNHKLMTRNCTRDAVPRDHRYRGPGVDYAKDPEFAGKPWPAGEAAAASSQTNENWTSNSKLSTQSTRKHNPQRKISKRKVYDFTA